MQPKYIVLKWWHVLQKKMEDELCQKIKDAYFIAVIADGATDKSIKENEAVCVRYVDRVICKPETTFVGLTPVQHAHADGVLDAIFVI